MISLGRDATRPHPMVDSVEEIEVRGWSGGEAGVSCLEVYYIYVNLRENALQSLIIVTRICNYILVFMLYDKKC